LNSLSNIITKIFLFKLHHEEEKMPASIFRWLYDWRHLVEEPTPVEDVEQTVELGSIPAFSFFFMLATSAVIATLGLLASSAAVVIGAMIIAPLMSPIIAVSYGLVARRLSLTLRSLFTVLTGTLLTVGVAFLITEAIGWKLAGPEVIARMKPSLLDLGIALAAGAAAAYAYTRPGVSSALAGIAIAVALVPPLCTAGITLAMWDEMSVEVGLAFDIYTAKGPFLLYLTNFLGIVFAGSLVFFLQYYRRRMVALLTLILTLGSLFVVIPPLRISMDNMLVRNQIRRNLTVIGRSILPEDSNARLTNLSVRIERKTIYVLCDVVSATGQITQKSINEIKDRLSEMIERPVVLKVGIIPETVLLSTKKIKS
jgi:uncharacterized hydrophobic protein (TIGR00271 family)